MNETHPPYYEGTDDYDLFVVRTLCPDCPPEAPTTRPVVFVITANAVVSIRFTDDPIFSKLHQRFLSVQREPPALMRLRSQLRRLEVVSESQLDAIDEWRDQTSLPVDIPLSVHSNDLQEYLRRVYNHALVVQQDIDALARISHQAAQDPDMALVR